MPGKQTKTHQLPLGDYSNFNPSIQRYQVLQRWRNLDPIPHLTIEPARHWPGRWEITITQKGTRWQLRPCLTYFEVLDLESLIKARGISLEIDLSHGYPIESEAIHGLVETYLTNPKAFAQIRRQAKKAAKSSVKAGEVAY